jgi:hypothetical protein
MNQKKSNYSKIINYQKDKFNNLNQALIFNNCKKKLENCMTLIEDNTFIYLEEDDVDQNINLEMSIILLQIFKDHFFKNNLPHITFHRCLNCKIQNWKYHHNWKEKYKSCNLNIMTEEEELQYHQNYNPPQRRDIYLKTFTKIKRKAWVILKTNYILEDKKLKRLNLYLQKNNSHIIKINIKYEKWFPKRTKWKSANIRIVKHEIWRKSIKFKTKERTFKFKEEITLARPFFKYS